MESTATTAATTSIRTVPELRRALLNLRVGIHRLQENSSNDRGVILGFSPQSYQKGAGSFENQRDEGYFRAKALELCDHAVKNGLAVQVQTFYTGKNGEQRAAFGLTLSHGNSQSQTAAPRLTTDETLTELLTQAISSNVDIEAILTNAPETEMGKMLTIARLRKALAVASPAQESTPPASDDTPPF